MRDALRADAFAAPAWVETLDVAFAKRYLEAYVAHRSGRPTTAAWAHAFARAAEPGHLLLQHLLLGMAAHILLDLGVATHGVAPHDLATRRADFKRIDHVLAAMLDDVQDDLNRVAPGMAWLDRAGGRWDEALARAALVRWRATAWRRALALERTPDALRPERVRRIDRATVRTARHLCPPPGRFALPGTGLWVREDPDGVPAAIEALR